MMTATSESLDEEREMSILYWRSDVCKQTPSQNLVTSVNLVKNEMSGFPTDSVYYSQDRSVTQSNWEIDPMKSYESI